MDHRFPKWLRVIVNKLSFLAIPNLGALLAGMAVLGYVANMVNPVPVSQFLFDADKILNNGEWWRLFTFPFMAGFSSPLMLLFYCWYVHFIMGVLEQHWGAGPLTVFMLFSYLSTMAGALILRAPVDLSYYIMENISFAVGTLLPDLQLSLMFILPIKAKWLAAFWGAYVIMQFLTTPIMEIRLFLLFAFLPYLVFFSPLGVQTLKEKWRIRQNRKRFDQSMWR